MRGRAVILVVEDNPDDAVLLEQAFLKTGLTAPVRFVCDGHQAIAYLEGRSPFNDSAKNPLPNLILVDLKMPGLNGFELLNWLCSQSATKRMLVGVLSGVDQPGPVRQAYRSGAKFHISKPHRFEDLVSIAQFLIQASDSYSKESASFVAPPAALEAILQAQTILPIHLKSSAQPSPAT
jgi:CheY-like chemotaxis protein